MNVRLGKFTISSFNIPLKYYFAPEDVRKYQRSRIYFVLFFAGKSAKG